MSEKSLQRLLERILPKGYRCENISLWDDRNALNIRLGASGKLFQKKEGMARVTEELRHLLLSLGFKDVHVTWGQEGTGFVFKKEDLLKNPLLWAALSGLLASFIFIGFVKSFLIFFWGGLGYGIARFCTGSRGDSFFRWWKEILKK